MRGVRVTRGLALAALAAASACLFGAPSALAEEFSVQTLHFDTVVGPDHNKHCNVIGALYRPDSATANHPAPAILTTNGFGGSKDDQAEVARNAAGAGYVVLSYS